MTTRNHIAIAATYRRFIALIAAVVALAIVANAAYASSGHQATPPITVISSGAESQFPEGVRFYAEVETVSPLQDIRVNFTAVSGSVSQYNYLNIPEGETGTVSGEYVLRLNTPDRYMPPGARMRFWFEVSDEAGNTLTTDDQELMITDARPKFDWHSVTSGPVTVMFSGPIETRANFIAEGSARTLEIMKDVTGSEIETPITVTLYANNADMIGAVQARSATISRELITEGQAFASENVVLVLAGTRDLGTASHEITHILVGRASGSSGVPAWLNEGLAEYGNQDPTVSYDRFLEWGVDTGRIEPLWKLASFPSDPNLTIVSYGQARSVVGYMVRTYGPEKMAATLALLSEGRTIEASLQGAYGFGIRQLDADWRKFVGAEPYVEVVPTPSSSAVAAGPAARPTLAPYSLTPAAGQATATPTGQPPTATPASDAQPAATAQVAIATEDPTPVSTETGSGGGCNSRGSDGAPVEASFLMGLAGLGGLYAVRRQTRRR